MRKSAMAQAQVTCLNAINRGVMELQVDANSEAQPRTRLPPSPRIDLATSGKTPRTERCVFNPTNEISTAPDN
jgi:hypothetical protein